MDLRRRIIEAVQAGASAREAASAIKLVHRWRQEQSQMTPQRLIFLDETGAKTNMARLRGRSLAGQRLHASVPFGRWATTTFVAGLRLAGWMAPMVLAGAINGASFKAYVERILAPKLRPGDLVVMDNLSSHKVAGVRQADTEGNVTYRGLFVH